MVGPPMMGPPMMGPPMMGPPMMGPPMMGPPITPQFPMATGPALAPQSTQKEIFFFFSDHSDYFIKGILFTVK